MINIHPKKSSVVVAISTAGLVNIADVGDLNSGGEFLQVSCVPLLLIST
jgi:hypothetical protein